MEESEFGKSEMLVVLDLDETLVHVTENALVGIAPKFQWDNYFVYTRPGLETFLVSLCAQYQVGIWSSAGDEYVAGIVEAIRPSNVTFDFVWGRSKCTACRDFDLDCYYWEKRLDKLKKRARLEKIVIVDDSPEKSRNNYGNAIYITPFAGAPEDDELTPLLNYLVSLKDIENVRRLEKRNWKRLKGTDQI